MIGIEMTSGLMAFIDDEDGDLLDLHWYINKSGNGRYAMSHGAKRANGRPGYLHHVIAARKDPGHAGVVTFADGDTLNCTRGNLVLCSQTDLIRMRNVSKRNTSGYKGVSELPNGRFRASICVVGVSHHLGIFDSAQDAAYEYDDAARIYFGEFARLNFHR